MKNLAKKILSLCMAVAMTAGMSTTALAAETRVYFTQKQMSPAPYRVTNVIADNATNNMTDNLPQWYEKGDAAAVLSWSYDMVGSVEITTDSIITLEFPYHNGIVLRQLDNAEKISEPLTWNEPFEKEIKITDISDYVYIKNDELETDEYGDTYYKEGMTVQFKKSGTYILTVTGIDGQTNTMSDYFAAIIFKVTDTAPDRLQ